MQIVAGVDVDPDVRDGMAGSLENVYPNVDAVLNDDAVDAVILCTPHKFHTEQIIDAAAHGKHVFCEKPLSASGEGARRAVDAITAAGLQLGIGHERRFEPAVVELRHAIVDGQLGTPLVFEGNFSQDKFLDLPAHNWRLSAVEAPVGPLSATGIHLVDLAISIFGRKDQPVSGVGREFSAASFTRFVTATGLRPTTENVSWAAAWRLRRVWPVALRVIRVSGSPSGR